MLTLLQLPLGPGLPTAILTAAPTCSAIVAASELPPLVVVAMGTTRHTGTYSNSSNNVPERCHVDLSLPGPHVSVPCIPDGSSSHWPVTRVSDLAETGANLKRN